MSDIALTNARARRDEIASRINKLQQQVGELRDELGRVDAFIADWHSFAGVPVDGGEQDRNEIAVDASGPLPSEGKRPRATGNPRKEDVADMARALIRLRGEPVSRDAIFADLEARGIYLKGADPKMVLSTMLWRCKDRVVRVKTPKGHRYWLAEAPNAAIGYDPNPPETEAEFQVRMDQGLTDALEAGLIKHPFIR